MKAGLRARAPSTCSEEPAWGPAAMWGRLPTPPLSVSPLSPPLPPPSLLGLPLPSWLLPWRNPELGGPLPRTASAQESLRSPRSFLTRLHPGHHFCSLDHIALQRKHPLLCSPWAPRFLRARPWWPDPSLPPLRPLRPTSPSRPGSRCLWDRNTDSPSLGSGGKCLPLRCGPSSQQQGPICLVHGWGSKGQCVTPVYYDSFRRCPYTLCSPSPAHAHAPLGPQWGHIVPSAPRSAVFRSHTSMLLHVKTSVSPSLSKQVHCFTSPLSMDIGAVSLSFGFFVFFFCLFRAPPAAYGGSQARG